MKSRDVELTSLFSIIRGKGKYTRAYGDRNQGPVPVYSASLTGPLTYIDKPDFSGPLLSFTTNGYGGSVQILEEDFAVNGDRAVLLPHDGVDLPDLRYLARVIEQALRPLAVGRRGDQGRNEYTKLSPAVAQTVSFPFLIDENGKDDFEAMARFGESVERAEELQSNLRARAEQIRSTNIVLETGKSVEVSLGDTARFSLSIGKRVLRSELSEAGEVPVYSANARAPMGFVKRARPDHTFEQPSLIWGIDGIFDWNLIPAGKEFVPTDHCGRLIVIDPEIDPEYLLHALRATRDEHGFDRVYRSNLKNIAELAVAVPVRPDGAFDTGRQKELAAKYRRMQSTSDSLLAKLSMLTEVVVTP